MLIFKLWFAVSSISFMVIKWFEYRFKNFFLNRLKDGDEFEEWLGASGVQFSKYMFSILKIDFKLENPDMLNKIDWNRNVFVTANHQSYMDIPSLYLTVQRHLGFVAKKDLAKIPILGFWLKEMGSVLLDRKKRNVGLEVAEILKKKSKNKSLSMVVFCEGSRSKDGSVATLKSGVFRYTDAVDGILVPVLIRNTYETYEGREKIYKRYPVSCKILEPIDFRKLKEDGKNFQLVRRELQDYYRQELGGRVF